MSVDPIILKNLSSPPPDVVGSYEAAFYRLSDDYVYLDNDDFSKGLKLEQNLTLQKGLSAEETADFNGGVNTTSLVIGNPLFSFGKVNIFNNYSGTSYITNTFKNTENEDIVTEKIHLLQTTFTGPFTSDIIPVRLRRDNSKVSVHFPGIQGTGTVSASLVSTTPVPEGFRPQTEQTFGIRGTVGSTIQMITARISTSGFITFQTITGAAFPIGGISGTATTGFEYDLLSLIIFT